jgi:hypothetical protein
VQAVAEQDFASTPEPVQKMVAAHSSQLPSALFKRYPLLQTAAFVVDRQLEAWASHALAAQMPEELRYSLAAHCTHAPL